MSPGRRHELTFTVWARDSTDVRDLGDALRHLVPEELAPKVGIVGVSVGVEVNDHVVTVGERKFTVVR